MRHHSHAFHDFSCDTVLLHLGQQVSIPSIAFVFPRLGGPWPLSITSVAYTGKAIPCITNIIFLDEALSSTVLRSHDVIKLGSILPDPSFARKGFFHCTSTEQPRGYGCAHEFHLWFHPQTFLKLAKISTLPTVRPVDVRRLVRHVLHHRPRCAAHVCGHPSPTRSKCVINFFLILKKVFPRVRCADASRPQAMLADASCHASTCEE